jgi:hypothetical protein
VGVPARHIVIPVKPALAEAGDGNPVQSGEGGHSCPPPYVIARNEAISFVILLVTNINIIININITIVIPVKPALAEAGDGNPVLPPLQIRG